MSLEGTNKNIEFRDNTRTFLDMFNNAVLNGLEAIGMAAETHAKKNITANNSIDTGRLRNSITYALAGKQPHVKEYRANKRSDSEKKSKSKRTIYSYSGTAPGIAGEKIVYIGTNVEYAKYVELGTSRQAAKPFLKPAAADHADEYRRIFKAALDSAD